MSEPIAKTDLADPSRPWRIELAPTRADAGPMPVVVLSLDETAPGAGAVWVRLMRDECRVEREGAPPQTIPIGEWCEAAPGWRLRVCAADVMPRGPAENPVWTAPELEITSLRDGREQRVLCAAPTEEGVEVVFGRDPECDVPLTDGHVSRRHLRVFVHRGRLLAEDLRSRWGTALNDRPLAAPSELHHGDRLVIGATSILYSCYWDVLTRPTRPETQPGAATAAETSGTRTDPGARSRTVPVTRSVPRPVVGPPPPPSAWEENAKIIALGIIALCCLALIILITRL